MRQSQERDRKITQIIRLEELYISEYKTSPYPSLQRLGYVDAETRLYKELHQEDCGHPASYQFAVAIAISQGTTLAQAGSFQLRYSCFLGEIVETLVAHHLDLKIRDIHGKTVELQFYTKGDGTELELSQYQRGYTVAVLNASQYMFKFGPRGIRQTDLEMMKVNTIASVPSRDRTQGTGTGLGRPALLVGLWDLTLILDGTAALSLI
ncbi:hypothetical protein E4U60_006565 [Claviceps pazoutovae]|uniref:Uncharacterized protein n=1 Tax=Claviceps pazoutovae TaxID=1649127 RepID=A0A9P7SDW4_9HYPO|nr:hypothetical protein E4U60_006565 [Claviceps pazoutovae]